MRVSTREAGATSPREAKQRLLEAAGEVFAAQGFQNATVRDICRRAGTNVAAVNYYFRGKRELYAAVLSYAYECALKAHPGDWSPTAGPPERRLRAFVGSLLGRVLDEGRRAWHGKLMAREMMQPTPALDALVAERIGPMFEALRSIIRELLGPGARPDAVRLCAFSVVGQCLHYHHARPVVVRLYPAQRYRATDIARLADHITRFSLAAMHGLRRYRSA